MYKVFGNNWVNCAQKATSFFMNVCDLSLRAPINPTNFAEIVQERRPCKQKISTCDIFTKILWF